MIQQQENYNIFEQCNENHVDQLQIFKQLQQYFNPQIQKDHKVHSIKNIPFFNFLFAQNSPKRFANILKYLFQYFKTGQSQSKNRTLNTKYVKILIILLSQLIQNRDKCINQIIQQKQERRQLINRFLSIPTIWFNLTGNNIVFSQKPLYNFGDINKQFFLCLLQQLNNIDQQNQFFIISKVMVLSQEELLFHQNLKNQQYIQKYIKFNFSQLPKKHKLLQFLFFFNNKKEFLNQLLTQNNCQKQILFLLSCKDLRQDSYINFYEIFCINIKYRSYIMKQLVFWWAISRDNLLTRTNCEFRYNLIAYMIQKQTQKQLIQEDYVVHLSQGIRKRIVDQKYYKAAVLIWSKLSLKLGIQLQSKQLKNCQYFSISLDIQPKINITPNQTSKQKQKLSKEKSLIKKQIVNLREKQNFPQTNINEKDSQKIEQNEVQPGIDHNQKDDIFIDQNELTQQIKIKPPKTIYDCILGLQNQMRRDITIKQLPKILKKYPDDIIFTWNQLIKQLLFPLQQDSKQTLIILFSIRPTQFIEIVAQIYFKKDASVNQKILFMQILEGGIEELSSNPQKFDQQNQKQQDFYFKKISSKYFIQKHQPQKKQNDKIRRWGHTRLQFQRKSKPIQSLKIIKSDVYINRFYQIANVLFFKIISRISTEMEKIVKKQSVLAQHILLLLGVIPSYLKNHYEKYLILDDITAISLEVVKALQAQKQKRSQSLNGILMSTIQILNKISLVIDKFIPQSLIQKLKQCIIKLKKMGIYGIKPLIELIEANIYRNMFLSRDQI